MHHSSVSFIKVQTEQIVLQAETQDVGNVEFSKKLLSFRANLFEKWVALPLQFKKQLTGHKNFYFIQTKLSHENVVSNDDRKTPEFA